LKQIEVIPVSGLPEVKVGDDLARLIFDSLVRNRITMNDGDILVIKQKIVSKSEGRLVKLAGVTPGRKASALAKRMGKDPKLVELVPCADQVCFSSSGTEAVQVAFRIARGYTGRSRIVLFHTQLPALGIANALIREELYDKEFIERHAFGFDDWVDQRRSAGVGLGTMT